MSFELLTKEDLLIAAIATKRPVAFLVGSPLSLKDGVGVPGVTEILDIVRDEIRDRAAFSLSNFDATLQGKTGGDAYQDAMKWLGSKMGQDAINDVIKTAVLKARKAGIGDLPSGVDGQPDDWNIPEGTNGLAELAARGGEKFLGPILTTNFDPLVSLAIHKAGGHAVRQVLTGDVTLVGAAADTAGICPVVHLHGFWRDSDTLHTQAQLTNPRPKLAKSLQRLLQRRTLIVVAYGGWEDFFTKALIELMNDEQAPLDVIWCFYESDAEKVKEKNGKLLAALEPAIVMNRFRAFGGIDCHTIFGEIFSTLQGMSPTTVDSSSVSPLAGWELIDAAYLGALPPLRPEEVIRYFDGATPTWRHTACSDIPNRTDVVKITRHLSEARSTKGGCSLQLIRAAGGEGKSTLLLQAAAVAVKSGEWNVLWRPASRTGLPPEHISNLDPAKDWLVVADDAENLVRDLSEAARLMHEAGDTHVHFLLAARDTDWRHFHGDRQSWGTLLKQYPDILLRELSFDDANMLIGAWQKYGPDGLRELASLRDTDRQVAALLNAVRGVNTARDEGSFFGGLLAVRFGTDGLRSHVVALLNRLKDRRIEHSDHTLFDALIYVAACHAVGIPGLDERVLADLLVVSRDWVQTLIVNPLGEEAAAVRSAGHVLTRHSKVAAAILVAAEQDLGADIAEVWSAIVRQTVRTGMEVQMDRRWFSNIIHAGAQLQRELPQQFAEQRRKDIAVAAAKARIAAEPERLCALVDLGKTYRNAGDFTAAIQVFQENAKDLRGKVDFQTDVRGYYYEWGVCEGKRGEALSNTWLCGLSLSDQLKPSKITEENTRIILAGLALSAGKLATAQQGCRFALCRRAAVHLGRNCGHDPKKHLFDQHEHDSDIIGTLHPKDIVEAIAWLTAGVADSGRALQDPFLKVLLKPERVSFNMLHKFLEPAPAITRAKLVAKPPAKTAERARPLQQLRNNIEKRIQAGIERVLDQAWAGVPFDISEDERFHLARRKASKIISTLSPHIKRQVGAYFQTQKWAPLKKQDPSVKPSG